ncbi:arylphorin subunit alpha-like [Epargyreus clarus]|uniref:arylphorin subunit alpha-like n=1 Tax=Epargyreus clarus TaxID=520877 RepID=UPI003C2D379F
MKTLTLLLLTALAAGAKGYLIKVPTSPVIQPRIAPVGWVHVQKLILPLFENVCEESKNPIVVRLSQEFKLDMSNGNYLKPEVITNLQALKTGKGLLPKGEIFTEYNMDHVNELRIIYELFYNAKDFDTFYKAACWARQNINCGLFVDALYSAILSRKDMERVSVPAPYEILPNYFIRKDFIIKASTLIAGDEVSPSDYIRNDGNSYILDVNYTTNVYDNTDESKLVYFYEDIGLNSYYYLTKLKMSSWINTNPINNKYGEYLYFLIKQLMARYNLERYSYGLPELEGINWDYINTLPYDPMLVYSDGNDFSHREFTHLEGNEKLTLLQNIENNIATIVAHMRDGGYNKSEILKHLMEILITSDKSYENLALQILSEDTIVNKRPPTVLGHYMTILRDPVFWAINKKMVDIVDNALKVLPGYTRNELYFPGVEVLNVDVKKMMTAFESFDFDVTDALETGENDTKFKVKISQSRLNHKPFSIKVNISSLVTQKGLLKIYLGPKVLPGEHVVKKNLFMLLDCSEVNLKVGGNIITRTSADMGDSSDDLLSLYTIKKKIEDAEFGLNALTLKLIDEQIKFPSRLVIPKGLPEGLPLQIFVFIVPFVKAIGGRMINAEVNKDALLSPGYPLDLDIEVRELFDLPNALVKDIVVTHKGSNDKTNYANTYGPKSWQNSEYNTPNEPVILSLAARPDFTLRKEPIDYKSKKGQYGKKEDYAAKRDFKYKKDYTKEVDKTVATNNDNYITKVTTDKVITIIPDDNINTNKDNFEYVVNTDMHIDGSNTFSLDKKIQDKDNNEEFSIDITRDKKIVPDESLENSNEINYYNKVDKEKHIDISKPTNWPTTTKPTTIKRFFSIYDILPDYFESNEKVYE